MHAVQAKVIRVIIVVIGILLVADTIFASTVSNINLGVVLPSILGTPLIITGIMYEKLRLLYHNKCWAKCLEILFILGYTIYLAATLVTVCVIVSAANKEPKQELPVVIVLGAGIHGEQVPSLLGKRLKAAESYYYDNPDTIIIVSGGMGQGETITEAEAMYRYLIADGIPAENIIKEEASTSTQENFRFSKRIMEEQLGIYDTEVLYITSDFHVLRAGMTARKEGLNVYGLASSTKWYIKPNCYLRETVALWVYMILGRA